DDLLGRGEGPRAGLLEVRPGGDDGQHATPGADQGAVREAGAGVDDVRALLLAGVDPGDRVAGAGGGRVAGGGDHDGYRGVPAPAQLRVLRELSPGRGQQQRGEGGGEPLEHHLGLGIAEAGVELDYAQPARGEGQAAVEDPDEGDVAAGELGEGGAGNLLEDVLRQALAGPGERGGGTQARDRGTLARS